MRNVLHWSAAFRLRTPDAVENRWPRCAKGRAAILPLPGGEGRGEGELWGHCSSSPAQIRGAGSGVLSLRSMIAFLLKVWGLAKPYRGRLLLGGADGRHRRAD